MNTCASAVDCGEPCCVHVGRCYRALERERNELLAVLEKIASGNVMAERHNYTHADVAHAYTRLASAAIAKTQ